MSRIPLLVVLGPTATGKTFLSVELATRLGGEIVSCDSMQVYRGMDIGTAKPTAGEMKGVRHHLLDVVDPDDDFSVADYQRLAEAAITDIHGRGRLPFLVGGTGLYLRAVLRDYHLAGPGPDEGIRRRLLDEAERKGREALHDRLARVDPESAARIHPNDLKRIIRALEVFEQEGIPISHYRHLPPGPAASPYDMLKLGFNLDRKLLYERINRRVDQMMAAGFLEEVKALLARGYDERLYSMQALGYKQLVDYLRGRLGLREAVDLIKRDTRRFARRQLIWFRREENVYWIDVLEALTDAAGRSRLMEDITRLVEGKWAETTK